MEVELNTLKLVQSLVYAQPRWRSHAPIDLQGPPGIKNMIYI